MKSFLLIVKGLFLYRRLYRRKPASVNYWIAKEICSNGVKSFYKLSESVNQIILVRQLTGRSNWRVGSVDGKSARIPCSVIYSRTNDRRVRITTPASVDCESSAEVREEACRERPSTGDPRGRLARKPAPPGLRPTWGRSARGVVALLPPPSPSAPEISSLFVSIRYLMNLR